MNKQPSNDLNTIIGKIEYIEKKLQQAEDRTEPTDGSSNLQDVTRLFDLIETLTQTINRLESEIDDLEVRLFSIEELLSKR